MTTKQSRKLSYKVIYVPSPMGGYDVYAPALPECEAFGQTLQEAKVAARSAMQDFLEELRNDDEPIPHDVATDPFVEKTTVKVESKVYTYTTIFEPALEGGYVVRVPALNGTATEGASLSHARGMVKDLIEGYLETLMDNRQQIPSDIEKNPIFGEIRISEPVVTA